MERVKIKYTFKSVAKRSILQTKLYLQITLIFCFLTNFSFAQNKYPFQNTELSFEKRAENLINLLTLEEKISQLGNNSDAIPRLGISPYDWWNECLHGVARAGIATMFPQAIGMAASFDKDMMLKVANVISDEARAKHHEALRNKNYDRYYGLTFWSPNVNIFRDPRWGRGHETYGEDPYLTGQMGIQFVKGLQGNDQKYLKLVATAKHFAVHNGPEPERHTFNVTPNSRDLWETYLPAFQDLVVDGKAYSVMSAYNRIDGESASASWMLLQDILRNKWGFDGYVVSDCGAIRDIYLNHKIVNNPLEAAAIGVRRGCDLNCGKVYQNELLESVKTGLIDEGEIDLAVYRLMLARLKLGMFDPIEMVPYAQIPFEITDSREHDQISLEMARKSITLLKNDGVLPLDKDKIKTITVIGPNANSTEVLRANYYGVASNPITILDGIKNVVGKNTEVMYFEGCPIALEGEEINYNYEVIDSKYLFSFNDKGERVNGLKGLYFNEINLSGTPVIKRIDEKIQMDWAGSSPTETDIAQGILTPDKKINNDYFSIRWTGQLAAPKTGKYKLGIISDDGCRLFVDGEKIVEEWNNHPMAPFMSEINLEEGKIYQITIEYYEATGDAGVHFVWESPGAEIVEPIAEKENESFEPSQELINSVKRADVALFVGGLDATWEGEEMGGRVGIDGFFKGDRTKIELPEIQLKTIEAMLDTGTPVVLVLLAGSSISFSGLENEIPAILMGWYPGQRGGDAVAEVLFGDYNPAGRLPVTFYNSTEDLADFEDYNMNAGKGQTYRYFTGKPLYSFGHGLSYTDFKYSDLQIDKTTISSSDEFIVSAKIKNIGNYDGEEVVQLYVRNKESDLLMPKKQLRGFERIELAKGEEKIISFKLKVEEALRYYDPMLKKYTVEPGEFEIQIGASSSDIKLRNTIIVR